MTLAQLKAPPIAEVVCGVAFDPISELDPLSIGWYSLARFAEYPKRQIQPVIADPGVFLFGPTTPIRAWLISEDEVFIVQVQHDRFFLNWRARGANYPRFHAHDAEPGILQRMLTEFDRFSGFCRERFAVTPRVRKTELTKIDHLVAGLHWDGLGDLGGALPSLAPLLALPNGDPTTIALNVTGKTALGQLHLAVAMRQLQSNDGSQKDVVILESRSVGDPVESTVRIRDEMIARNEELNGLFERLMPADERIKRFGGGAK